MTRSHGRSRTTTGRSTGLPRGAQRHLPVSRRRRVAARRADGAAPRAADGDRCVAPPPDGSRDRSLLSACVRRRVRCRATYTRGTSYQDSMRRPRRSARWPVDAAASPWRVFFQRTTDTRAPGTRGSVVVVGYGSRDHRGEPGDGQNSRHTHVGREVTIK